MSFPTSVRATGYGVVDMGDAEQVAGILQADEDELERPDPVDRVDCGCINRGNPYHECTSFCEREDNYHTDHNGITRQWRCTGECYLNLTQAANPSFSCCAGDLRSFGRPATDDASGRTDSHVCRHQEG